MTSMPNTPTPLQILRAGQRTYRLWAKYGSGAHGHAFLATDEQGRLSVVKRLLPIARDQRPLNEVLRQLSAAGAFDVSPDADSGVVQLLDAFPDGDDYYIVTELCHGSLSHLIADGIGGPAWVLRVAQPTLGALARVHAARGIVHRDLHLGNVFYVHRGGGVRDDPAAYAFKLADFSLATR